MECLLPLWVYALVFGQRDAIFKPNNFSPWRSMNRANNFSLVVFVGVNECLFRLNDGCICKLLKIHSKLAFCRNFPGLINPQNLESHVPHIDKQRVYSYTFHIWMTFDRSNRIFDELWNTRHLAHAFQFHTRRKSHFCWVRCYFSKLLLPWN